MTISIGFLSTYPPTQCGIATFSQSQIGPLVNSGVEVGVVEIVDSRRPAEPVVTHQWVIGQRGAAHGAARALNGFDVAVIQHEYGIFGGRDGRDVLDVLAEVRVPVMTILHTVLTDPTPHQHYVLDQVVKRSAVAITMTETGRQRLIAGWGVDPDKVIVIPHGAHANGAEPGDQPAGDRPTILTWGLIGDGKGIEWAIEALAELTDLDPAPRYRIVGQTHPRVLEREGEAYRQRLLDRVAALGVEHLVEFDATYHDGPTLRSIVRSADFILLPYDSREQVTSGVLTEAVVAGKPVISTAFPHAVELLSDGAGLLVPQRDPQALAAALRRVLTDPPAVAAMAARSRELSGELLWPTVSDRLLSLGESLITARTAVA
ncbi:MAG: glycosyltransferase [Candidatus Nanopelagicales bacterium]